MFNCERFSTRYRFETKKKRLVAIWKNLTIINIFTFYNYAHGPAVSCCTKNMGTYIIRSDSVVEKVYEDEAS